MNRVPWSRQALCTSMLLLLLVPRMIEAQAKGCINTIATSAPNHDWTLNGVVASGRPMTPGGCPQVTAQADAWTHAASYSMTPLGMMPMPTGNAGAAGTISFTRSMTNLYIGFTVGGDKDLSSSDRIIVVFHKNPASAHFDTGDFAVKVSVNLTDAVSTPDGVGTNGCSVTTTVQVDTFKYDPANPTDANFSRWDGNATKSALVSASVAYDYNKVAPDDAEHDLWNVEIKIPIASFGLGGGSFAYGAYVFVDQDHLQFPIGNVLRWPEDMDAKAVGQQDFNIYPSNPAKLALASFGTCYDVNFAVSHPLTSNAITEINNPGTTKLTAYYFFKGPGTPSDPNYSDPTHTNSGDVRVHLFRHAAAGQWLTLRDTTFSVTATGDNLPHHVEFDLKIAQQVDANNFCSDIILKNWQLNDNRTQASDSVHSNIYYIQTSEVTKDIDLAPRIPGLAAGAPMDMVLHITTLNDPQSKKLSLDPPRRGTATTAMLLLAGLACVGIAGITRRRARVSAFMAMTGVAILVIGCPRPGGGGSSIGTERWSLENAAALGLSPIRGEPDWYRMPARNGELKRARFHFTGRTLPYRTVTDSLSMADSTGRPRMIRIPAQTGQVISIFALGTVDVDGPDGPAAPTDANGFVRKGTQTRMATAVLPRATYPLRGRYVPSENVGTLVGSFDGFKTSFLIGTNAAFVVPQGTEMLSLAVNGALNDYLAARGKYTIKWITTPPPNTPTLTSYAFNTPLDRPRFIMAWEVLSSVNVYAYYEADVTNPVTKKIEKGRALLGDAHIGIYESHQ